MSESTVHIAVYDTLSDWEVGYLTAHLNNGLHQHEPGHFRIATVGVGAPVTTMGGLRVTPDVVLADLDPQDSAMLVVPGSSTWESGALSAFGDTARDFLSAGTSVAAIRGATYGLAKAGLLDERPHTSNDPDYLASSGYAGAAHYLSGPVVDDDGLITANAVAPVEFARSAFARLDAYDPAVLASWYKLYGEQDPAGYYELVASDR